MTATTPADEMKVAAVLVTYNRKDLLRQSLQALVGQIRPVDEVIIIDNVSTDGTDTMISEEFPQLTHVRMEKNLGGAGGFYEGIKRAYERGHDLIWVMDDDTVPDPHALDSLLSASEGLDEEIGFLCSHVVWTDGRPHEMNFPRPKRGPYAIHADRGMIAVTHCSFVSVLLSRRAIQEVGLPIKEMFIYGDDWEYTQRISRKFPCYYVLSSRVTHMTRLNIGPDIGLIPADQMWKCFYDARNKVYIYRQAGRKGLYEYFAVIVRRDLLKLVRRRQNRGAALSVYLKGAVAGWWFSPVVTRL